MRQWHTPSHACGHATTTTTTTTTATDQGSQPASQPGVGGGAAAAAAVPKQKRKFCSAVHGMSVGEERKCLNQIRKAKLKYGHVRSEFLLLNGETAGDFALKYLLGIHEKRKKQATATSGKEDQGEGEGPCV